MRKFSCFAIVFTVAISGMVINPAAASVIDFTSSAAFNAATSGTPLTIEQYASGTAGQTIPNPGSFNVLTYSFTPGPSGTLTGGIITNKFNSFSGLSLGGNQSDGAQFFFGGDSLTITFPTLVTAVGAFFNVNLNSGNFDLNTPVGSVSTTSSAYDTSSFVFDGITSSTPFSTITLISENASLGSFNVPEIEFGFTTATVPLPATLPLFASGLGALGLLRWRRKRKAKAA